mmetsp:Transcript_25420/g.60760  ORF Transcript_25420/g.60760 Transcript_25420/m.60760 type:complete len:211 (+) Transcript_25420:1076-1708(+)
MRVQQSVPHQLQRGPALQDLQATGNPDRQKAPRTNGVHGALRALAGAPIAPPADHHQPHHRRALRQRRREGEPQPEGRSALPCRLSGRPPRHRPRQAIHRQGGDTRARRAGEAAHPHGECRQGVRPLLSDQDGRTQVADPSPDQRRKRPPQGRRQVGKSPVRARAARATDVGQSQTHAGPRRRDRPARRRSRGRNSGRAFTRQGAPVRRA